MIRLILVICLVASASAVDGAGLSQSNALPVIIDGTHFEGGSFADWIQVVATLLAAAGLFYTARAFRLDVRQRRLEVLSRHWSEFWESDELPDIYYRLEYGRFRYDPESFHGSEDERQLDHLLGLFQHIALQHRAGLVTTSDLEVVAYHSQRVFGNREVKKYLAFLADWAGQNGLNKHPFSYAESLNILIVKRFNIAGPKNS